MPKEIMDIIFGASLLSIAGATMLVISLTIWTNARSKAKEIEAQAKAASAEQANFGKLLDAMVQTGSKYERVADSLDNHTVQSAQNQQAQNENVKALMEQNEALQAVRAAEFQSIIKTLETNDRHIVALTDAQMSSTNVLNILAPAINQMREEMNALTSQVTELLTIHEDINGGLVQEVNCFNRTTKSIDDRLERLEKALKEAKKKATGELAAMKPEPTDTPAAAPEKEESSNG